MRVLCVPRVVRGCAPPTLQLTPTLFFVYQDLHGFVFPEARNRRLDGSIYSWQNVSQRLWSWRVEKITEPLNYSLPEWVKSSRPVVCRQEIK
jgi:hypothetical protein